jgi:hypothetical protein
MRLRVIERARVLGNVSAVCRDWNGESFNTVSSLDSLGNAQP